MEGPRETLVGGRGPGESKVPADHTKPQMAGGGTQRLGVLWGASFSFQELEPGPALGV